ncbi:MAG: hypothetical protein GFH27_549301n311 [Chloroflexi bacterium AL-W]|nr:hypothetical protein [Chloroflexi bacterium AL-N1]NOK68505.1 hypothetical protein [Chloroflexi bacterium AL-N10]NOK74151.1 hypothetical protein [Chloroflexi bacterium AL-N5]NOK83118.1 hypothetical protein [Chloroflexi bacterium AL-W]NOK90641.1 hypothetical protein [Chloroflexi bacterium AL-N15]
MNCQAYHAFTNQLVASLTQRADVLGLVAVGSMAAQDYQPDAWSDHDFYVITQAGAQEHYRIQYTWLPDHHNIAWTFQETAHGVKVIYQSGHLLEYAVFDEHELQLARSNRYRVLLDRSTIDQQMAQIATLTNSQSATQITDFDIGQFLTNILTGVGRYARGEVLSAHHFAKGSAVEHLVRLIQRHVQSEQQSLADNLDPKRRFELVYPALGVELRALMVQEVPIAAVGLLKLFGREFADVMTEEQRNVFEIVSRQVAAVNNKTA